MRDRAVTGRTFGLSALALAALCVLTGLTMLLGYANKARCTGPEFDESGVSGPELALRNFRDVCYSDLQHMWDVRDLDRMGFPYATGGITEDGGLYGDVVEYPVLLGVLIWLGSLFVRTDAGFLVASALLLAPFGLLTAWWLGKLSRWRALWWALGPPLVLYSFHNWDLAAVACSVGAVYAVHRGRATGLRRPALQAAVLLGIGAACKLYPAMFALPLVLYVLTGGTAGVRDAAGSHDSGTRGGRFDVRGALAVLATTLGTFVLVNLPFALIGPEGWAASFRFQLRRSVDVTTNSVWYWGLRPALEQDRFEALVGVLSPVLVLGSFVLACAVGLRHRARSGTFPWVAVSAAMLCGFLLLHKVHSPQFALWLLPFLVLVPVRSGWLVAYLLADLAMGVGFFRWMYLINTDQPYTVYQSLAAQAVMIGVWGRAALLVGLFVAFLGASGFRFPGSPPAPETAPQRERERTAGG